MAANSPLFKGYSGLVETPRSGTFEYAERISYTQEFEGTIGDCYSFGGLHPRGTVWILYPPGGGSPWSSAFCVEKTNITKGRGAVGTVMVNYLWLGANPPD